MESNALISGNNYYIKSVKTGMYLDVCNASFSNGQIVWSYKYNGTIAQKWKIQERSAGEYSIMANSGTGNYCLDVPGKSTASGTGMQIWQYLGDTNQRYMTAF